MSRYSILSILCNTLGTLISTFLDTECLLQFRHVFDPTSVLEPEEMRIFIENCIREKLDEKSYLKFCYNLRKYIEKFLAVTEKYCQMPETCVNHRDRKPTYGLSNF